MKTSVKASEIINYINTGYTLKVEDGFSSEYYVLFKVGEDSIYLKKNSALAFIKRYESILEKSTPSSRIVSYDLKRYDKTLSLISVRSSQNSFSSTDIYLYSQQDLSSIVLSITGKVYKQYVEINGEMVRILHITVAPEFSITDGWRKDKKREIANKLLSKYPSLIEDRPDYYEDYLTIEKVKYQINYEKRRIDADYVLTRYDYKKQTTKDYIGGFGLEIIFVESLISYIEQGLIFGYIGHSCRKVWVDTLLASICLKHISPEDFAAWLTSTAGRHFGDYIEDMVDRDDKIAVEAYIKEKLPAIHDKAVIFNHPLHKGNLKSSLELFETLKDMGMMMSDSYTYLF